jgi:hypothetical protein
MDATSDALTRAYLACAEIPCPKCSVEAWQNCRNKTAGTWLNTRFHKPRQTSAGVSALLGPLGIHHLRWQPSTGQRRWDGEKIKPAAR